MRFLVNLDRKPYQFLDWNHPWEGLEKFFDLFQHLHLLCTGKTLSLSVFLRFRKVSITLFCYVSNYLMCIIPLSYYVHDYVNRKHNKTVQQETVLSRGKEGSYDRFFLWEILVAYILFTVLAIPYLNRPNS